MLVSCSALWQVLVIVFTVLRPVAAGTRAPQRLPLSWMFSWDPQGTTVPIPITAQCETIHISWSRNSDQTGPDGVAPYYLHIYTSNFIFPFIVPAGPGNSSKTDVTIPFAPGTLYQICMFDSVGNTGGCQAVYTVYQNSTSPPSCANFTMPAQDKVLQVDSQYSHGNLSQFGWVDSCTDISLTPKTGIPPFTFTVAPALHPPINITSPDMSPINWTVSLSWASPFFISLADSTGKTWSNGPIHSGDGKTACLDLDSPHSTKQVSVPATVGVAISGLLLGTLASLLAVFAISRRRKRAWPHDPSPFSTTNFASQYTESDLRRDSSIHSWRPLVAPDVHLASHQPKHSLSSKRKYEPSSIRSIPPPRSPTTGGQRHNASMSPTSPTRPDHQETSNQVYVIHHDSGGAPVSVVTSQGTRVVELPPGYSSEYSVADAPTGAQAGPSDASEGKSESLSSGGGHV